MNSIAEKIRNKRSELGLTQEQLAIKAGIPYTTLSKIENDLVPNPTIKTLKKIADALGILVDDLLGND
ncbi:MAG: helix-turn-helix transcriptional regulator [Candidatus Dojkabacteria bacterium]|nr:MAG: helix-turn-helix transcriptional regulator [Candidatus Dojkabacteria bacterium]